MNTYVSSSWHRTIETPVSHVRFNSKKKKIYTHYYLWKTPVLRKKLFQKEWCFLFVMQNKFKHLIFTILRKIIEITLIKQ